MSKDPETWVCCMCFRDVRVEWKERKMAVGCEVRGAQRPAYTRPFKHGKTEIHLNVLSRWMTWCDFVGIRIVVYIHIYSTAVKRMDSSTRKSKHPSLTLIMRSWPICLAFPLIIFLRGKLGMTVVSTLQIMLSIKQFNIYKAHDKEY